MIFLLSAFISLAQAVQIPKGLTSSDRIDVVRMLGTSTSTKSLNHPYALGGYSGFEIGYSLEFINVRDLQRLGCTPGSPGCANTNDINDVEWRFSRLTIGKGLYNNIDVFFSLMLPMGGIRASDYGALVRWSFFQAEFLPINLTLNLHTNHMNFSDRFTNNNVGGDVLVGVTVDDFALYFGGGSVRSTGTFLGPSASNVCGENCTVDPSDPSINAFTRQISETITQSHMVVGFSYHFANLFAAAQVDRYREPVYSLKTGLRF